MVDSKEESKFIREAHKSANNYVLRARREGLHRQERVFFVLAQAVRLNRVWQAVRAFGRTSDRATETDLERLSEGASDRGAE